MGMALLGSSSSDELRHPHKTQIGPDTKMLQGPGSGQENFLEHTAHRYFVNESMRQTFHWYFKIIDVYDATLLITHSLC